MSERRIRTVPGPKALALLVTALTAATPSGCGDLTSPGEKSGDGVLKVLLIGSSLLSWNTLPLTLQGMADAAGEEVQVRGELAEGRGLDFFADDYHTERVIGEEAWDLVVLGGGVLLAAYPDIDPGLVKGYYSVADAIGRLDQKIKAANPKSRTVYMIPWAYEDGMTWGDGHSESYTDMQLEIRNNAVRWADSLGITLAPAGMAWFALLRDGRPVGYLHQEDKVHPNPRGSYLTAATILATILREGVEDVAFDGSLDPADALMLRETASLTVTDSLALWNITP